MEHFLDQIGALLSGVFSLAQGGFDGVNQVVGLLIALVMTLLMPVWRAIWAYSLGAALVHIIINTLRPVMDGGAFALPDVLTLGFWTGVLALFLGYVVVIAIFFFLKTLFTGLGGHRRHRHAH